MTTANGEAHGLQDLIADQCRQHEEIITAYVFGSRVKGRAKPDSDTDSFQKESTGR
ncbi:MAG: nucleotidyltransferase domain-containing protein [Desulfohalobiaceae bacterium]|nr:nucleotidyltransferase domain-containing protein [Desulfohalobiaceae bacterium]